MTKLDPQADDQVAAIPYRLRRGHLEVALVTSRRRHHWVVPKGTVEAGEARREAALREAREEAGLLGRLHTGTLGSYRYVKLGTRHRVRVYLMRVKRVLERWEEDQLRERAWVSPEKAIHRVRPELRTFLSEVRDAARL